MCCQNDSELPKGSTPEWMSTHQFPALPVNCQKTPPLLKAVMLLPLPVRIGRWCFCKKTVEESWTFSDFFWRGLNSWAKSDCNWQMCLHVSRLGAGGAIAQSPFCRDIGSNVYLAREVDQSVSVSSESAPIFWLPREKTEMVSKHHPSGITMKALRCLEEENIQWAYFKSEPVCRILAEWIQGAALLSDFFLGMLSSWAHCKPQRWLSLLTRKSEFRD